MLKIFFLVVLPSKEAENDWIWVPIGIFPTKWLKERFKYEKNGKLASCIGISLPIEICERSIDSHCVTSHCINSNVRSVLDWRCLFFPTFSFSLFSSPKSFLFPAAHKTYLRKTMILDSFTVESSWNLSIGFGTHFQTFSSLGIMKTCWRWEKYPLHHSFFFFRRNPKLSQKNTILDSLTVGLSWNFDM